MGPKRPRAFIRYATERVRRDQEAEAYRLYIAESLRLAPQMKYMATGWNELVSRRAEQDGRSGDEIAIDVIQRAGLEVAA